MRSVDTASVAATRRRVVDRLRTEREVQQRLVTTEADARALLEEVDYLELVAGAADALARFPTSPETDEAVRALQQALQRWKE